MHIIYIREAHAGAFEKPKGYIQMYVIDERMGEYMTSIQSRYKRFLSEYNIDFRIIMMRIVKHFLGQEP